MVLLMAKRKAGQGISELRVGINTDDLFER